MRIVIIMITLLAGILTASAGNLQIEENLSNSTQTIRLFAVKPISKEVGIFAFAVATKGWGQAYTGLDYTPNQHVNAGLGYGVDSLGNNRRFGGYVTLKSGTFALKHTFEGEGSGEFHQTFLSSKVTDKLTIGVTDNKLRGFGPLLDYKVSKDLTVRTTVFPKKTFVTLITQF